MRRWSRSIFLIGLLVSSYGQGMAQAYGNEWIDFDKSYYKISTADNGIFRIEYQDLVDAGIPVAAINATKYQLFHRGVEQALFIENAGASQLEPGEFIEFYGQRNDGTLDSMLYQPNSVQPNKFYNLYSDSTAYFLTWITGAQNGKRMSFFQEANISSLPVEPAHNEEVLQVFTQNYSLGRTESQYASLSTFDIGEGWTGVRIQENSNTDFMLTGLSNQVQSSGFPDLELQVVGRNSLDHLFRVLVGSTVSGLRDLGNFSFSQHNNFIVNEQLQWADISASGELIVRIEVLDNGAPLSNISTSYIKVRFPQDWDMGSLPFKSFNTNSDPGDKSYIEILNTPTNPRLFDITDLDNVGRIGYLGGPNQINAIIPNTATPRNLFVTTPTPILTPPSLKKVSFRNIDPTAFNYLIISHPYLMQPAGSYADVVRAYSDYRASAAGGGYDTLVVSAPDLFDQFSYGETSPLSIYNFTRMMIDEGDPEYLFLIGKALTVEHNFYRQDPSVFAYPELVPTAGIPGSDAVFTAGLDGAGFEPRIPTGRISANTPEQVAAYFDKVKEKEAQPFDNLWQKELLHLSGGLSQQENVQFENIVNGFGAVAEDIHLGGAVGTVSKNTTNTVEFINISQEVNDGLLFITFFGHSAPNVTDIDIGFVSNPSLGYDNQGKYPIFLVNGCEAGNFFTNNVNWGTDWIVTADKGAVGFIAHSSFGFVNTLKSYSDNYYQVAFGDSTFIDKSAGIIQNETAKRYQASTSNSIINIAQIQQMVFLGDPAIPVFGTNKPDYQTEDVNVFSIEPEDGPITSITEEFDIGIITKNFGNAKDDSLTVSITRYFADGTSFQYDTLSYSPVYFQDTLIFPVSNDFANNAGLNRFEVTLNVTGDIDELNLTNNSGNLNLVVPLNGTVNLRPLNYAVIDNLQPELLVQAADLLTKNRTYLFEMDTVISFDSPYRQQTQTTADDLVKWKVELIGTDSTVYYWRTKFADPRPGEEDEWEISSFSQIAGSGEGWGQIEWEQFQKSTLEGLVADTINQVWNYKENEIDLYVKTYGTNNPDFDFNDVEVEIDGLRYIFPGRLCRDNTINAIAFNNFTAAPYAALFEDVFSPRTCGRFNQVINNYIESEILSPNDYLIRYIDAVDENDQVALFTIGTVTFSSWTQEIWDKLEEVGVDQADLQVLNDGDPVIIVGRKGDSPGTAMITTADYSSIDPANEQEISIDEPVIGRYSSGTITSTAIGPALSWNSLFTSVKSDDPPSEEQYNFNVFGISDNGSEILLLSDIDVGAVDLSGIDASLYSNIRLNGIFTDETNLTAPQLDKWIVNYQTPPDGILSFEGESLQITVQEGQEANATFGFINISDTDFVDSLEVAYSIFNLDSRNLENKSFNISPISAGDTAFFEVAISTLGKQGLNDLTVVVNETGELEQTLGNNFLQLVQYLLVQPDEVNPVVDVTIDGEHIFDGDIVSPSPIINILVWDENPYLTLGDTSIVDIFLKKPCEECVIERINYSDPAVSWKAAEGKDPFTVEYAPQNLDDGIHKIEVQASDESGNKSGEEPYRINFEIINESAITHFYPYPNPFSSSTRFVFTLTGSEIPDQIKIQILTISGRVVREITQDELGPIKIGNNISEFAWDGRDEFGDQLANGVYLYKVIAKINGENLDLRETSADGAFKNGMGKLYLLR